MQDLRAQSALRFAFRAGRIALVLSLGGEGGHLHTCRASIINRWPATQTPCRHRSCLKVVLSPGASWPRFESRGFPVLPPGVSST